MVRPQRLELLVFVATFVAFAYFNQGGGWNQNARFAEVRAMVEQGRFAIDDYLVYERQRPGDKLLRLPVEHAEYSYGGKRFRLSWVDNEWNFFEIGDHPLGEGVEKVAMFEKCASGDIGFVPTTGHFHPNKPPGTSFFGLPAYFAIYHLERLLGADVDDWRIVGINAWLTSVFSVGLISALGCVLFFRLAREFARGDPVPALLATFAFAFGTTFFPFGTLFFDHNLTAVLLIGSFYLLRQPPREMAPVSGRRALQGVGSRGDLGLAAAGLCAGLAAITNYIAAVVVVMLGAYALLAAPAGRSLPPWRTAVVFGLGVLPPFLLICWFNWTCFGSPFRLSTDFQNPLFKGADGALGMFTLPNSWVAGILLFSGYRGIFFLAPVLLMGVYGLFVWLLERRFVVEARLFAGIFAFFFLVNTSFNGFHAGFSAGPRYLIPGIPFLALPLVVAFARWRKTTSALAAVSIVVHLLLTATDAQNPTCVGGHARPEVRESDWEYNIVADYAWPLFAHGRAWPLLKDLKAAHLQTEAERIAAETEDAALQREEIAAVEAELAESVARGDPAPLLLASVQGPVSVNPVGVYEGLFNYGVFGHEEPPSRWASFNVGEFLFPQSRWSLLPLLILSGGASALAVVFARRGKIRSPAAAA